MTVRPNIPTVPQLFDLHERDNLAVGPGNVEMVAAFMAKVRAPRHVAAFNAAGRASRARQRIAYPPPPNGAYYPCEFQPPQKASERRMRNHVLEDNKRFPRGE